MLRNAKQNIRPNKLSKQADFAAKSSWEQLSENIDNIGNH